MRNIFSKLASTFTCCARFLRSNLKALTHIDADIARDDHALQALLRDLFRDN